MSQTEINQNENFDLKDANKTTKKQNEKVFNAEKKTLQYNSQKPSTPIRVKNKKIL